VVSRLAKSSTSHNINQSNTFFDNKKEEKEKAEGERPIPREAC